MTLSFRRLGAFAALVLASAVVHAQAYTHQVFLDRDQDAATGCAVATAAGAIAGIDTRLTATIAEYPASVQSLTVATCTGGAFGAEATLSGGYPVGYDLGAGGSDVIEFAVDAAALAGASDTDWTLWFVSTGVSTGAVDLVGPVTAQGLGGPAQPAANPAPVVIPALDPWAVLLLALAMGVCLAWAARRYRGLLPVLVVGAALSMAGIAWAAGYLLDGAIGDWDTAPLASDPAGDPTVDDPGADLRQVFAAREGARLFFRSDVAEAQIEKLIAGLLATAFSVDENPANGTVVGELRAVTTGLGSLLQFQLLGQGPANAFAVDADGTLSVADGSLVDAESTPVFTLDVQVSINGVAALTIQVDVTVTVDGVNEAPVVDAATFSIPEDSVDGAGVGTVTFADPDTGQAHVFAITAGDAGGVFAIDASTGAITVADAAQLDFATTPSYALTVSVTDNGTPVLSGSATITIEITETDDPPVAVDDAATVAEDAPATAIDVLANDTDTDAGPLLVESVTQPANGTVAITGGGSGLTYAPNADYCNDGSPVDTFTYTLNGGSVATVAVTVTCVDDDPVAVDDAAAVTEDDAATPILVLANDTDSDGGAAMSIASVVQPANGTVAIAGDSLSLTYQPAADYCNDGGPADTFTYALAPGGASATVSVAVACVDDLPVAVDDAANVAEDAGATVLDVLANDTDVDGGPISVQSVTQPANGAVAITGGGTGVSYTPSANYCNNGSPVDSFTYTLNGGSSATVSVTVPCGDDAPVAVADAATVAEDSGASTIAVLANDTDLDGGPIAVQSVTQPANGTVVITNGGADLTYAPDADYCNDGSPLDTFAYTLNGGSSATVSVTVTCDNDAPAIDLDADDSGGTVGTGFTLVYTEGDGAQPLQDTTDAAITDIDSATLVSLTVTLTNLLDASEELLDADVSAFANITKAYDTTTPGVGVLTISSVTPQPIADYVAVLRTVTYANSSDAPDTTARAVEFVANDGALASNIATANVNLAGVDTPPVAVDDATTVAEDAGVTAIDVLANDTDSDGGAIGIASVTQPANGAVVITGGGTGLTYAPDAEYCNAPPGTTPDTFTYALAPGGDTATVSVTVTCVDDDPTAVADAATVTEDAGATAIDVLANDTDADGGAISVTSVTQPANGTVAITGGGTGVSYTPDANYCNAPPGTTLDTFTYTLAPGGSSTTVTLTVTCVEDDPVAVADAATVTEDSGANAIDVLANDTDPDGGTNSITSVTQPANGSVSITGGGTGVSYTPNANYCNNPPGTTPDTFTYTLTPGGASTTVSVSVTCVDDPPVAVTDAATVLEDAAATAVNVLANDTDVDGGAITVASVTQPANGTVVITGGGTGLTYAPNANYCNDGTPTDGFTYTLTPGGSSTTVAMTVTCVNDPPVAGADAYDFIGNTELRVDLAAVGTAHALETTVSGNAVLGNDSDPVENDPVSVAGIVGCADTTAPFDCTLAGVGTVSMQASGSFSFVPAPGDADAGESFQYLLSDGTDSVPGTVTLTRTQRVWYVDNSAAAGGNGTSVAPFSTITAANLNDNDSDGDLVDDLDGAGDVLFVYFGNGTASGLTGGLFLEGSQRLIGQHAGLSLAVNLNGNGAPTVLVAAVPGSRPLMDDTVADGYDGVAARNVVPAEITGMNLAGNVNAIDWTTTAAFAGTGAFRIHDNVVRSAGAEGVDVNLAGTGATTLEFHDNTLTATGTAVDVAETGTGTLTISRLDDNVVSGNTGGSGIVINTATLDAVPGGAVNTVDGGTTLVGASGNGVGGAGLVLTNVQGDLHFTGNLSVYADGGAAVGATGTGAGLQLRVNSGGAPTGIAEATGGPALDLSTLAADLRLTSLRSTNSASTGVSLTNVTGTVSAPTGSAISNATGTDFAISGGTANVTYGGTITDDVGQLVSISGTTAGTKAFEGAITDGDDGDGSGISLSGNTGATIRFSGGLVLSTGANAAFAATGGGTVTVCDEHPCNGAATGALVNRITTTTGTALNVANTTIASSNLEFRSISAGTLASGPVNGIVLNTTGASGGLKVKGTGTAGSGGTIQNASGDGISLASTQHTSLAWMDIDGNNGSGIAGSAVTNLTLANLSVMDNTDALVEAGLKLTNVFGVSTITNVEVGGSTEDNISVTNNSTAGTLASLTISGAGCLVHDNSTASGNVGINIQAAGSATMGGVVIDGCTLRGNRTVAIRGDAADSSSLGITIRNNVVTAGSPNQGNQGIEVGAATSAQVSFFDIDGNSIGTNGVTSSPLMNTGINVSGGGTSSCRMTGHVRNNTVVNAGAGMSGFGIRVFQSSACVIDANVTNNLVSNVGLDYGLIVESGGSAGATGGVSAAVTNNNVSVLAGALDAVRVQARNASTMCARVTGNTTSHPNDAGCTSFTTFCGLVGRQANTAVFNLEGGGGACPAGAQSAGQAALCLASQNNEDTATAYAATSFTGVATNFCGTIP